MLLTCDRWEEDADKKGERRGNVGHDLVVWLSTSVLNVNCTLAVGYELALLQERREDVVVEHATGQTLDALDFGHVIGYGG